MKKVRLTFTQTHLLTYEFEVTPEEAARIQRRLDSSIPNTSDFINELANDYAPEFIEESKLDMFPEGIEINGTYYTE